MSLTALVHPLTASAEPSLWEEIWAYIVETYFTIDWYSYNYQYLTVTDSGMISLRTGIAALLLGVILAAGISLYQKRTLGDLVRAIDREWCVTPESAKTLTELGLIRNTAIKADLRHGHSLRRVVRCAEEEAYNAALKEQHAQLTQAAESGDHEAAETLKKWREIPYRLNFETDHFYIPESLIYGADNQFDKRGTTPLSFLFCVIVCVIMLAVICFFLPEVLQLTDNVIGMLT
jgi:hypothetical protein